MISPVFNFRAMGTDKYKIFPTVYGRHSANGTCDKVQKNTLIL